MFVSAEVEHRWVSAYFPFTHPSWELEIKSNDRWIETVGCGVIRHEILEKGDFQIYEIN